MGEEVHTYEVDNISDFGELLVEEDVEEFGV